MAAKNLGKARPLSINGLSGVNVASPVYQKQRLQFNNDPLDAAGEPKSTTVTVLVDFFQDQATFDAGGSPYHTESYQIDEPAALDALIETGLKGLPDFDAVV